MLSKLQCAISEELRAAGLAWDCINFGTVDLFYHKTVYANAWQCLIMIKVDL